MDEMLHHKIKNRREGIKLALARRTPSILLKGGNVVNVFTGEIYKTNIAIYKDKIIGVGDEYLTARKVYKVEGSYILPGFIDAHIHLESSLLTPGEFAKALLLHGTTSVICDPHELANVFGLRGIKYVLEATEKLPVTLLTTVPSCVPATPYETTGSILSAREITTIFKWDRVIGLGEVMDTGGLLRGDAEVLSKIIIAEERGLSIDGHAPGLSGKILNAYIGSGIHTDHESTTKDEAMEKLRLGMYLMIREGSAAKNMQDLLSVIGPSTIDRCIFVSDDKYPDELLWKGHMDHILKKSVMLGLDPVSAIKAVTINPARAYKLSRIGAIAPGYMANIVLVKDLTNFEVVKVFYHGNLIVSDGKFLRPIAAYDRKGLYKTFNVRDFSLSRLKVFIKGNKVRVIEIIPGQIYTRHIIQKVLPDAQGEVLSDPRKDILKVAVIERHHGTGNMAVGFVKGFGLKKGALASSVAHDAHNIIVVGANDRDMYVAVQKIIELGGGQVICAGGEVIDYLSLPIGGLLSDQPLDKVVAREEALNRHARELGTILPAPFITLSFLSLAVIPELKITDKGLIDVDQFKIVGLEP